MSNVLPTGHTLPAVKPPVPTAYLIAWLGLFSTTVVASPSLTADEQARLKMIRDGAVDARASGRAQGVLSINGVTG